MKCIPIFISSFFLLACGTFKGIRQTEPSFPDMTPQLVVCIENTLRGNNQITFIRYEKSPPMEGITSRLIKFTNSTHYFFYTLKKMIERKNGFQIYITESRSTDQNLNWNHYNHVFGYKNNYYSDEERNIGTETITLIDREIKKNCLKSSNW